MRIVWLCLASGVVATGSAAVIVEPWTGEVGASADMSAPVAPSRSSHAVQPAPLLPVPVARVRPLAPQPLVDAGPSSVPGCPAPDPATLAMQAEIADLCAELQEAENELRWANSRLEELVADDCEERFDAELDQWLDGPLLWVHRGDEALRGQLCGVLYDLGWTTSFEDGVESECPVTVALLRTRVSDGVVIQLADLFRAWTHELALRPTVEFSSCCGMSDEPRLVSVQLDVYEIARLPDDHPFVLATLAEQRRINRDWQTRINALLGATIYDVE